MPFLDAGHVGTSRTTGPNSSSNALKREEGHALNARYGISKINRSRGEGESKETSNPPIWGGKRGRAKILKYLHKLETLRGKVGRGEPPADETSREKRLGRGYRGQQNQDFHLNRERQTWSSGVFGVDSSASCMSLAGRVRRANLERNLHGTFF